MWAVTANPLGWRSIVSASECVSGEVAVISIPDGLSSTNAVWDATLNGGSGGVRPMTPTELAASQAVTTANYTGAQQTETALLNLLNVMVSTTPFTNLSPAQQTVYNVAMGRSLLYLVKG